ncbi:Gamma-secretase aspartyl protease complex, presenilin enhancer-2 subunit [Quillaja saponaria]|uniref:Gamma-secretase aspartyl protease complex, presenilin enhancer-2 subunit n=1 Tax=Quillaja saponaria TaxID=32244 RepID=A0AAD7P7S2_QUISA|nr:Gamma-secretase aspartyl protease complex, presenilin enhancer-2 subunit [Quillaja saponaria]
MLWDQAVLAKLPVTLILCQIAIVMHRKPTIRSPTTLTLSTIGIRCRPSVPIWPTIDGPLGLSEEDSVSYARRFYKFGFALLPWLWAVNCFYFWPVLRHSRSFPRIRRYIIGSAVGFTVFTALLGSWALTFAIGGEHLFGPVWDQLVMYNLADRLGLTGWS